MPLHVNTPVVRSTPLRLRTGRDVLLKLDALQPSGSFKLRGVGLACEAHVRRGARRFVASSGGNAGLAVAYAGRQLGVPVTVVIPETTPVHARTLLEQEGAEVIVHGAAWVEANEHAQGLLGAGVAFVHPFDDPLLWEGHATLIDEVVAAGVGFDGVVLSVGGGGLFSGVVEGLRRNGLADIPVIAVETEGANCLARALAAGAPVVMPAITSVATSLGASRIADRAFTLAREHPTRNVEVDDLAALDACLSFLDDHRLLVEPACGAALAVLYDGRFSACLNAIHAPLVVVCGGATATHDKIVGWRSAAKASAAGAAQPA
jgi:L-serine/L-threonine ammonia-lyase